MHNCVVSGNRVVANSPIANSASAGGIGSSGQLDIEDSTVSNNIVEYTGSMDFEDQSGFAGGLIVDQEDFYPHPPAIVRNTKITGNHVSALNTNPNSTPSGYAGGVASFASALFDHVAVTDNSVDMRAAGYAGGDGGGMEIDSPVTMRDSLVARNSLSVQAPLGAIAFGGGIAMFGADLTLERTVVVANSASATSAPGADAVRRCRKRTRRRHLERGAGHPAGDPDPDRQRRHREPSQRERRPAVARRRRLHDQRARSAPAA